MCWNGQEMKWNTKNWRIGRSIGELNELRRRSSTFRRRRTRFSFRYANLLLAQCSAEWWRRRGWVEWDNPIIVDDVCLEGELDGTWFYLNMIMDWILEEDFTVQSVTDNESGETLTTAAAEIKCNLYARYFEGKRLGRSRFWISSPECTLTHSGIPVLWSLGQLLVLWIWKQGLF